MAENAVGSLLQTLGSFLLNEGSLIWGLDREIREIQLEFQSMQSFLKGADMRQITQEGLRTWVEQVRNTAYDTEDIIDKYAYFIDFMDRHRQQGLLGAIYNTISMLKKIYYGYRIAGKLQDIKSRLKVIEKNRIRYALPTCEATSNEAREVLIRLGQSSAFLSEDRLVGIERNRDLLINWLTNEEPQRMAYSVVGMGGLGKTTLVAKAYDSSEVQNHFDCCAWVTVSQSCDTEEILRDVIKQFRCSSNPKDCDGKGYRELVEILNNHLQLKRYVLILDDLWRIDDWVQISVAFPDKRIGSRIVITTRDEEVASHVAELQSRVIHPQHLDTNEAWTLFCQRAFKNNPDGACPNEFESSARSIVHKCDGLPLAIVTTGSLMASKQSLAEWRNAENSFGWLLSNSRFLDRVKNVLLLSYYELPIYLKQCFLYLCAFPEDYKVHDAYLIRMWVAEGFVEKTGRLTLEDAAMNYINELVGRCMIQYVGTNYTLKCYRVHDVLREIGVSIAKDENFIINSNESKEPQDIKNARRLFLQFGWKSNMFQELGTSNLRSYIFHGYGISPMRSFTSFKLLRVLHLDGASLEEVPNSFGQMFNLQYLSLARSNIRELPNSLERLRHLRTLNIAYSKIEKLPSWIVKLKEMRHLNMSYGRNGVEAPMGICTLETLQALEFVEANAELLKKIGNLTQLKWLGIENVKALDGADFCASLQRMESLLELTINYLKEQGPLELEALYSPPLLLQFLVLNGKLERLPHWFGSLKHLKHLFLWNSNLSVDPLSPLQDLPNLEHLWLRGTYDGNQLFFRAPSFLKLKKLHLQKLKNLDMVQIEDGAMCDLQHMDFSNCEVLKTLPLGIEYLRQLRMLSFNCMPKEFKKRLGQGGTEEDRLKIQHIAIIRKYYSENYFDPF